MIVVGTPATRPTDASNATVELLAQLAQQAVQDPDSIRTRELKSGLLRLFTDVQPPHLPLQCIDKLFVDVDLAHPPVPEHRLAWRDKIIALGPVVGAIAIAAHLHRLGTQLVRTSLHETGLRTVGKHLSNTPYVHGGAVQSPDLQRCLDELRQAGTIAVITGGIGIDIHSAQPTVLSRHELRPTSQVVAALLATTHPIIRV